MTGKDEPDAKEAEAPPDPAAVAVDEVLRVLGATPEAAKELVEIIQQAAAAQLPGFPGMTAEETTRTIVRRLAEKILAKRPSIFPSGLY